MYRRAGIAVLAMALGGLACERSAPAADTMEEPGTTVEADAPVTAAEEARVVAVGSGAAERLRTSLVKRLTAAIDSAGAAHAISVCSTDALALTDSITRTLGPGVEVKRTALRVRNPDNAPDSLETLALAHFTAAAEAGDSLPRHYVQRTTDGFRYYEPLVTMPLCLQCHGPGRSIAADVRAEIAERYPQDRAIGYRQGELRGLIRVSTP